MKLTEKYELLELVSSGRVSTFLARERTSHEQVVVHTFECPGASPPSSTAAILIRFGALAPNPPGDVLKAGLDEVSSSAFIVTKMPPPAALQEWVRAYRFFPEAKTPVSPSAGPEATAEISAEKVKELLAQSSLPKTQPPVSNVGANEPTAFFNLPNFPAANPSAQGAAPKAAAPPLASPPVTPQTAGEFTRMFRDLGAFQSRPGGEASEKPEPNESINSIPTGMFELPALRESSATPNAPSAGPEAGEFTKQFFASSKNSASGSEKNKDAAAVVPPVPKPEPKPPGSFTQEFLLAADKSRKDVAITPKSNAGPGSVPAKKVPAAPPIFDPIPNSRFEPVLSEPTFAASGDSATQFGSNPAAAPEPPSAASSSGGEFTSFFRGPFDQPGASKPIVVPDQVPVSPKQQSGEFTRVFGKGTDINPEDFRMAKPPEPSQKPESFTQMFGASDLGKLGVTRLESEPSSSSSSSSSAAFNSTPFNSTPAPPEPSVSFPSRTPIPTPIQPPSQPAPFSMEPFPPQPMNTPSPAAENAFMNRARNNDATDVFRVPGGNEPPIARDLPSGPSEFTMFLSRSQVNAAMPPEPAIAPAPSPVAPPAPSPFSFAPPPVPQPPALPPLVPPPAPRPPQLAIPKAPAVPGLPKLGAAAGPSSFWPLITVLTILVAIGLLLVMYFVLKH